uniref:Uncharacterized protein n=1 Tax=Lygus hesperus TaxID=30085 RepID=A0A146LI03_LYGHE
MARPPVVLTLPRWCPTGSSYCCTTQPPSMAHFGRTSPLLPRCRVHGTPSPLPGMPPYPSRRFLGTTGGCTHSACSAPASVCATTLLESIPELLYCTPRFETVCLLIRCAFVSTVFAALTIGVCCPTTHTIDRSTPVCSTLCSHPSVVPATLVVVVVSTTASATVVMYPSTMATTAVSVLFGAVLGYLLSVLCHHLLFFRGVCGSPVHPPSTHCALLPSVCVVPYSARVWGSYNVCTVLRSATVFYSTCCNSPPSPPPSIPPPSYLYFVAVLSPSSVFAGSHPHPPYYLVSSLY